MNLEDLSDFHRLDTQNMMSHIYRLPQQISDAWDLGLSLPLPEMAGLRQVLFAGMGGSACGADLLAAYSAGQCPLPLIVQRGYDLPAWAQGPATLVVASSFSGDTEETLAVYEQALARECRTLAVSTGGRLLQAAQEHHAPAWQFEFAGQPRAAVGFSFGLLLAALHRLGLLPDPSADLHEAMHALRNQQTNLLPEVPVAYNPAKRLAGQLMGRWVAVFAADFLEPVARRWKALINENAKAWGQFDVLPEADHNTLAGLNNPESLLMQGIALFLEAPSNHPRNRLRLNYTRELFMAQGINTDLLEAKGETSLGHMWTLLHLGDYVSYYLAMAYGEDPSPVEGIAALKDALGKTNETK